MALNTEEQVEQLLGELSLRQPSAGLDRRVLDAAEPPHRPMWTRAVGTIGAIAAALLVAVLTVQWLAPTVPDAPQPVVDAGSAADRFVEATLDTTELYDDGLVRIDRAGQPVHRVRQVTTKKTIIRDERSNETLQIIEPREETYFCVLSPF